MNNLNISSVDKSGAGIDVGPRTKVGSRTLLDTNEDRDKELDEQTLLEVIASLS